MSESHLINSDQFPVPLIEEIRAFQAEMERKYMYSCHVYVEDRNITVTVPKLDLRAIWNYICDIAKEIHNIDLDNNRDRRTRIFVTYRQVYSVIARRKGYSLKSIGNQIGKDHATILNNLRMFKTLRSINDPELMPVYNNVVNQLRIRINARDIEPGNSKRDPNESGTLLIPHKQKDSDTSDVQLETGEAEIN